MNPRLRMCKGKVRHSAMAKAEAHIRHLVETGKADPGVLRAYPCSVCAYYHVGHKSKQQQRIEARV